MSKHPSIRFVLPSRRHWALLCAACQGSDRDLAALMGEWKRRFGPTAGLDTEYTQLAELHVALARALDRPLGEELATDAAVGLAELPSSKKFGLGPAYFRELARDLIRIRRWWEERRVQTPEMSVGDPGQMIQAISEVAVPESPSGAEFTVTLPVILVWLGKLGWESALFHLELDAIPVGAGEAAEFMPHPSLSMVPRDEAWLKGERNVQTELDRLQLWSTGESSFHIRWRMKAEESHDAERLVGLSGDSASGAMLLGAARLCLEMAKRGGEQDRHGGTILKLRDLNAGFLSRVIISAAVKETADWGPVGGFPAKSSGRVLAYARDRFNHSHLKHHLLTHSEQEGIQSWIRENASEGCVEHSCAGNLEEAVEQLHELWLDPGEYLRKMVEGIREQLFPLLQGCLDETGDVDGLLALYVQLGGRPAGVSDDEEMEPLVRRIYEERLRPDWPGWNLPSYDEANREENRDAAMFLEVTRIYLRHRVRLVRDGLNSLEVGRPQLGGAEPVRSSIFSYLEWFVEREVKAGRLYFERRNELRAAIADHRHLIFEGSAGSGKSTVALIHALALALAIGGDGVALLEKVGSTKFLRSMIESKPLPVLVRLRDYRDWEWPAADATEAVRVDGMIEVLGKAMNGRGEGEKAAAANSHQGVKAFVLERVRQGRCFLIFDGVDELPARARVRFGAALLTFVRHHPRNRVIVTTRPEARPDLEVAGLCPKLGHPSSALPNQRNAARPPFQVWSVEDFDEARQHAFLTGWYSRVEGLSDDEARTAATQFIEEVWRVGLAYEARDPLALTSLALIKWRQGSIPSTKVEVWRQLTRQQFEEWGEVRSAGVAAKEPRVRRLGDRFHEAQLSPETLSGIFEELAAVALYESPQRPGRNGGFFRDEIVTRLIRQWLGVAGREGMKEDGRRWAEEIVDHVVTKSSLIREREDDRFEFSLWTLRNFHAGIAFMKGKIPAGPVVVSAQEEGWDCPVKRAVSEWERLCESSMAAKASPFELTHCQQALASGMAWAVDRSRAMPHSPDHLLWVFLRRVGQLQDAGRPSFHLTFAAARLLIDSGALAGLDAEGPQRFKHRQLDPELIGDLRRALTRTIAPTGPDGSFVEIEVRAAAAALFGSISDLPDRLLTGSADYWCRVGEKGALEFEMGDHHPWGGGGARPASVPSVFYVARDVVTVDDFQHFVEAGGYSREAGAPYWKEGFLPWQEGLTAPSRYGALHPFWRTQVFQTPNHPRVGISWFEAMAYCEWMSSRMDQLVLPPEVIKSPGKWAVRLPSEAEWEFAARGVERLAARKRRVNDARRVPWGWDSLEKIKQQANCESMLRFTSAVGMGLYPTNRSPWGTIEMIGNIWQWCVTRWIGGEGHEYPSPTWFPLGREDGHESDGDPELATRRVVRGGSWGNPAGSCRCAMRRWNPPGYRSRHVGFRLVLAPVLQAKK